MHPAMQGRVTLRHNLGETLSALVSGLLGMPASFTHSYHLHCSGILVL